MGGKSSKEGQCQGLSDWHEASCDLSRKPTHGCNVHWGKTESSQQIQAQAPKDLSGITQDMPASHICECGCQGSSLETWCSSFLWGPDYTMLF